MQWAISCNICPDWMNLDPLCLTSLGPGSEHLSAPRARAETTFFLQGVQNY